MRRSGDILLEICVDDLAGIEAAMKGGAGRVELCSALPLGGLTPSFGLMNLAATFDIVCNAMIRPRAGDFVYSEEELDVMLADIAAARSAGLAGVVLGASLPDGRLDRFALETLVKAADDLDLTLHRAFDLVPDIAEAVELAVTLGFSRILTSGRAKSAAEGLDGLKQAMTAARGRISIMPGSGIDHRSVGAVRALGVTEVHASCSAPAETPPERIAVFGFASPSARRTDPAKVASLRKALDA
ncbi:MAG: copper homeostasis protein CutC [Rhizobiaceae bacterium]|nr:copper homeostasis protein CutC [Rhizobiaceae bacterium]